MMARAVFSVVLLRCCVPGGRTQPEGARGAGRSELVAGGGASSWCSSQVALLLLPLLLAMD